MAHYTSETTHSVCTSVNKSQVAKDTADRIQQKRAPVKKCQVVTDIAHKRTLGGHTSELVSRG